MRTTAALSLAAVLLAASTAAAQEPLQDAAGCKDHPLFTRMPNTLIGECAKGYEKVAIKTSETEIKEVEGQKTFVSYDFDNSKGQGPSFFQIVKNYENALATKYGGKKLFSGEEATFYAKAGDKDIYVVLNDASGINTGNFGLTVVEAVPMKQEIQANDLLDELNKKGSVALYINFETGKADIKPDSQAIVQKVADMLKASPDLKVSVEGHTDNVGTPESNKVLSEARAKSVMNALVAKGVAAARLSAKGWGQEKAVADNATEEGKAKNRRVEIVKQAAK